MGRGVGALAPDSVSSTTRDGMLANPQQHDAPCPKCGGVVTIYDWWDDPVENGGAIIGTYLACKDCDWSEDR